MEKIKAAIIGSGNIGTDLMYKILRSPYLELSAMIGIIPDSDGLARARSLGIESSHEGIAFLQANPEKADIVFDATSAKAHVRHAKILRELGKIAIDLTPAARGPLVVPVVNLEQHIEGPNVNLITCGGQATIPMVYAVSRVQPVEYAEIVATVSSKSAGPGTRHNIDEFTQTTARALEVVGGAQRGKAIIILNPANPPIMMRDTVYCKVQNPDEEAITSSVQKMAAEVQQYVPGYRVKAGPLFDKEKDGYRVTIMVEVTGAGDYLPSYAGNLDIMTAAAVAVGERFAKQLQQTGKAVANVG
ncbi:MAG TPA: acetaldehyde dehydrogenase (acetylating) [Chloroflexia bacterium]|nr:acetaldehyde dehydrogenase (acetylating) [Chloroflexia bacterium]